MARFYLREGADFNETFSLVSTKDAFRIVMDLATCYNLELHQMDIKIAFLNSDLEEKFIYSNQKVIYEMDMNIYCAIN